eukprot:2416694-Rhodomonas_salina.1
MDSTRERQYKRTMQYNGSTAGTVRAGEVYCRNCTGRKRVPALAPGMNPFKSTSTCTPRW